MRTWTLNKTFAAFACAMVVVAIAGTALAASAQASTRVHVRIETPDATIFNGAVDTGPGGFSTLPVAGTACEGVGVRSFAATQPSAVTALRDAIKATGSGFWNNAALFNYGLSKQDTKGISVTHQRFSYGPELCRVGRFVANKAGGAGWRLKINNRSGAMGGPVTPNTAIGPGAQVLWYYSDPSITRTSDLQLPTKAPVGKTITGRVSVYDNATDLPVAADLLQLAGANLKVKPGVNGNFTLKFASAGTYVIGAGTASSVRGSDVICVYERGSGDCGTRKRHR
ncbi:MAG: hypothetical protein JHC87_04185 [Thermoleophilaceae bacterium]|nr:hypothetical protein [Thermoleophilaceae bacterium]